MSGRPVHDMATPWVASDPRVVVAGETGPGVPGGSANLVRAPAGTAGATVAFTPATPLDLSGFDEMRFWLRTGEAAERFPVEFSYSQAGAEHAWLVAAGRPGRWEQRRIGIEDDARNAITDLRWRLLTAAPCSFAVAELLAVRDEMTADVDAALARELAALSAPAGALAVTMLGVRPDPQRSPQQTQQDSFRIINGATVCDVRPGPRAYLLDYQITLTTSTDTQRQQLLDGVLRRLGGDALRVNGVDCPIRLTPAEPPEPSPRVTVGSRMEVAPRRRQTLARKPRIVAGQPGSNADTEEIAVRP